MRATILCCGQLILATLAVVAYISDAALAENDSNEDRGAELYRELCAGCHGRDGHPTSDIRALLKPPPSDLVTWIRSAPHSNDDIIEAIETGGRRNRLHYGEQLSGFQLRALADYLRTLAATGAHSSAEEQR